MRKEERDERRDRVEALVLKRTPARVIRERTGVSWEHINKRARELGVVLPRFCDWEDA